MLSDFLRDIRYAVRALLRGPTFTVTIVGTLALGIGANAVIFSAVDAVLLRDAPVADPHRLVSVFTTSGTNSYSNSSYPDYFDLRDSGAFAALAAHTSVAMTMTTAGGAEPVAGELVSGNYFEVLGVKIPHGRALTPADDRIGAPVRVAVLSHGLWRGIFDANPSLIGQAIRLNGNAFIVVGIAPPGFRGPNVGDASDVWVPTALQPEVDPPAAAVRRARGHAAVFDLRRSRGLRLVGRLPDGAGVEHAAARADVVARRLEAAYPDTNRNRRFTLAPLGEGRSLRADTRPVLRQLGAAVSMVLLVACVNIASLLLVRAVSREREMAIRMAIGAGRGRLIRQWLTESVLLGILGALGGLVVAGTGAPLLHRFVIPDAVDLSVNTRVLGFTLIAGIASGLLFGVAPIVQALRRDASNALRDRGAVVRRMGVRSAFVVLQIAASLVLVVGAGLYLRTLGNAYAVDLGFQIDRTVVATINLDARGYFEGGAKGADAGQAIYDQILSRVEAIPGVVSASAARMTVLSGGARSTAVSRDGRPIEKDQSNAVGVRANVVSHRYFETMGIPILRGRSFSASDGPTTGRVTIVTKSLADRLWPNADAIGQPLRDESGLVHFVAGVVPDTVYTTTIERDRPPTYYLPLAQNYESAVTLHVRTAGHPLALVPAIRDAVHQIDSELAIERPRRLRDVLDTTLSRQRMMATLVGLFGGLALLLAVGGLYGVMAHAATERTAEIGIRLALGAQPAAIVTLLMGEGLRLLGMGVASGLAGALMATRYIESQLFGVSATDPLTFTLGCAVLAGVGLIAAVVPALRVMRVDPVIALRRT